MNLNKNKVGLATGSIMGGFHLCWSLFVLIGWAQIYMDWIFGLHFVNNPFQVQPFSFSIALTLIIFTFIVGYVVGWLTAMLLNWFHRTGVLTR
ncbi:MAG: hypothetical protein WCQ00_00430 [bacterium]